MPLGEYENQHYSTTPIPIVKFDSQQGHDGAFSYAYETGNGISAHEEGFVKNQGVKDGEIQVQQGYYSYTGPDGVPVSVQYIADENGFQAQSDHLPKSVPLPEANIKAIAEHEAAYAKVAQQQPQQHHQQSQQHHQQQQHQQYQYQAASPQQAQEYYKNY